MAAFGAQVVPGSTDWLVRPNTRCGEGSARILSDNNQTMDVVADSPPSQSYQLDYKCKMTPFVCVKPDPDEEFITDRHRVMTSQFDYNSLVASGGRARLLGDEFRQRQGDWPITSGFHDSDANAGLRLQEEILAKYRRRLLPEELVDASVVDHRLQAPSWNNVTSSSPPEVAATSRVAKYSLSEREAVYDLLQQQSDVYNRYHRDGRRGDQTLPPPLDAVKEDNEPIEDDASSYHPRRLMFAVDKEQKQSRSQNRGVETRYPPVGMERRHSPPELSRRSVCSDQLTPPGSDADLSSTDYSYERRQTWPLDSPFLPSWRRKVHHDDGLQSDVGGDSMSVESDSKKQLQQQHPVPAAAGGAVGQDGRSPISELMQMYDVAMTSHLMKRHSVQTGKSSACSDDPMTSSPRQTASVNSALDDTSKLSPSPGSKQFSCHICPYIGDKKNDFDAHMRIHFDHWCPYCNYSSRTEGRLRCHIKMFHSSRDPLANGDLSNKKRPKSKIACRHCDFSTKVKEELWLHMRQHIPPEKMLECPRCTFVTDLKHHLEYHLRSSHIGSKPYKCDKCTYRCFNQSMLNSHAKSHTNVYQFRCRDCPFAAKYCHALKVHIRRYGHEAAPVLNEDGSQPADGSGDFALISRRGRPRGLRGGAQGDMPRFRSVRSRNSAQNGGGPNAKPPVLPAVEFLDTKLGPSMAMPGNMGFQDIEKMFFGQRSTSDQVLDHSEGALPSFAKLAGKAGLPQLYTPELALAVSGLTSYPERRDVTLASCSPPNHQQRAPLVFSSIRSQLNDVVMTEPSGCFMKTHPRPPGVFDHDDRMFSPASQSTTLHQNLSPPPYSYNDEGDVPSPPIPEPERGQCGDLPLDLTLPSGRQREEEDFTELERVRESEKLSRNRKRSPSPDDDEFDEQVFRRRRHFREWFKLQSLRHDEPVRGDRLDDDPDTVISRRRERNDDCVADVELRTSAAKIEPLTSHGSVSPYPGVAVNEDANDLNAASADQSGCNAADRLASPSVASPGSGANRSRSSSQGSSDETSALAGSGSEAAGWVATGRYQCVHCEIDFHGSRALHAMHMSYHSNADPFRCNVCGEMTEDRVAFFEHLARVAHN